MCIEWGNEVIGKNVVYQDKMYELLEEIESLKLKIRDLESQQKQHEWNKGIAAQIEKHVLSSWAQMKDQGIKKLSIKYNQSEMYLEA